ncbi:MAG TPA: glycosyltransferase [Firmicutes bacterium]|jgi:cellulose synthase/poly-beta-1,6-N-acetylglucosamine synthase-like glycosyltransferase|nr:glycosyltransferase [Bacillota bacterium]
MIGARDNIVAIVLVLLAVYGLWTILLTLRKKMGRGQRKEKPFISILVIARNDEACIEGVVRWLLRIDYHTASGAPNFEVVVICGGSQDQTLAILERLGREEPQLIIKPASLVRAYEEGLASCRGEVICLLDLSKQPVRVAGHAMERMLNE